MKKITFIVFAILFNMVLLAQHSIEWQKNLGGTSYDVAYSIQQTTDGGYITAGYTSSTDGDVSDNHGNADIWVVKLDDLGDVTWQKCLGGSDNDYTKFIQQTTDDGYIIAGYTSSTDGDVSGNHGSQDIWIVKLKATGDIDWQKCLGGSYYDAVKSIRQTTDGGYIVVGSSSSTDGDVSGNHGDVDAWVIKLDESGDITWQKCLGGTDYDVASSVQEIADGDYIIAGYTSSNDGDVSGNHGDNDVWIVKLTSTGTIKWQECLGGTGGDYTFSIQQTIDGGYVIAGSSSSIDGDVSGNHGNVDIWVVKLDDSGNVTWQKCLGGTDSDYAYTIQQITDGGYIIAGYTNSTDGDVSGNHGDVDAWIVRLDISGDIEWQKCLGGTNYDVISSIQETAADEYIMTGYSSSTDGDVSANNGATDVWVVKLSKNETIDIQTISNNTPTVNIYPNPVNNTAFVNISAQEFMEVQITIVSITGQVVSTQNVSLEAGQNIVNINTSSLEKGTYILKLTQNQEVTIKHFVK